MNTEWQQCRQEYDEWMNDRAMGRTLVLSGVFCPFFWISVFSDPRGYELYFNAAFSLAMIFSGVVILKQSQVAQTKCKEKT